jgi:hypothetical protein
VVKSRLQVISLPQPAARSPRPVGRCARAWSVTPAFAGVCGVVRRVGAALVTVAEKSSTMSLSGVSEYLVDISYSGF